MSVGQPEVGAIQDPPEVGATQDPAEVGATQEPAEDPGTSLFGSVRSISDLLASGAAFIAIGGGLMYALVALGYQRFYGRFGITASDVGITQSDIIAQTAVALALVGSVTFIVWLPFYGVVVLLVKFSKSEYFQSETKDFQSEIERFHIKGIVITVVAGLYVFVGYSLLAVVFPILHSRPGTYLAVSGISFITILTVLIAKQMGSWPRKELRRLGWFIAVALPLLFLISVLFTIARAESASSVVSKDHVFPPGGTYTFLLDIRADPVCVQGVPGTPSPGSRAKYYFGRSGGLLVLYDPQLKKTIIKPANEVELAFVPYDDWPPGLFPPISAFDNKC